MYVGQYIIHIKYYEKTTTENYHSKRQMNRAKPKVKTQAHTQQNSYLRLHITKLHYHIKENSAAIIIKERK